MLPVRHRLTRRADFTQTTRHGVRVSRGPVVVHLLATATSRPPRVGFVVSRQVGGSVVRHRVTRRLRALMAEQMGALAPGTDVVVRALASSALADHAHLRSGLEEALSIARQRSVAA